MEKLAIAEVDARTFWENKTAIEAQVRKAVEKLAAAKVQATEKVAAVEAQAAEKVSAAEAQAREAMEQYKGSTAFVVELSEAAMDAFSHSFERCKERVSRTFKISGLERLQPEDEEEDPESSDTEDEPGPSEA